MIGIVGSSLGRRVLLGFAFLHFVAAGSHALAACLCPTGPQSALAGDAFLGDSPPCPDAVEIGSVEAIVAPASGQTVGALSCEPACGAVDGFPASPRRPVRERTSGQRARTRGFGSASGQAGNPRNAALRTESIAGRRDQPAGLDFRGSFPVRYSGRRPSNPSAIRPPPAS